MLALFSASTASAQVPRAVFVFPSPGSRLAPPGAQVVFRGLPVSALGRVSVVGSRSGRHAGRLLPDSDGLGGSFIPVRGFTPGETVTVRTGLHIAGARHGTFRFTVAEPAAIPGRAEAWPARPAAAEGGDGLRFHSVAGFSPEAVRVLTRTASATPWDIFLTPQAGSAQTGAMIVGPDGSLIWFQQAPRGQWTFDFQTQTYRAQPVLTWWQGYTRRAGFGLGEDLIYDTSYHLVSTVHAADGLSADVHEFQITPQGTALVTAYFPVYWNPAHGIVWDGVVQEIDIPTGLLLFQWDSLDHIPLSDSYNSGADYFHLNSIEQTPGGSLLISGRNTWAGYLVDHGSGRVIWRLGGKRSSFKLGPGAGFAFQHDVRLHPRGLVTLYDDGAGASPAHKQSRGLTLALDTRHMSARLVRADVHTPPILAYYEGSDQLLANGHSFVGWGESPYFTEFDAQGHIVFDGRFAGGWSYYRAFLEPWSGNPTTPPAVAATISGAVTTVYASWNGTTSTTAWRVLAGNSPQSMRVVETVPKTGFETTMPLIGWYPDVQVQALGAAGNVLGTSAVVKAT
jgi:hypothetical protein